MLNSSKERYLIELNPLKQLFLTERSGSHSVVLLAMRPIQPHSRIFLLLFLVIATDQFTKIAMTHFMADKASLSLGGEIIRFSMVKNSNGFLGIATHLPDSLRITFLYGCVSMLILGCLIYLYFSRPSRFTVPLIFVTGGGLSNLVDRFVHNGGVIDFISIGIGSFRTGIFNLADVFILSGSTVLGFYFFSPIRPDHNPDQRDGN
ncbi:MAG: signal peptidase II [Desulforhopalus sp.]